MCEVQLGPHKTITLQQSNIRGEHGPLFPAASKSRAGIPKEKKEHPNSSDLRTYHSPVALNKEGQHGISSATGFQHLQAIPIQEAVDADLAVSTGADDSEEEKGHVKHLPGREQGNRQHPSSGKLLRFVCSLECFANGWGQRSHCPLSDVCHRFLILGTSQ